MTAVPVHRHAVYILYDRIPAGAVGCKLSMQLSYMWHTTYTFAFFLKTGEEPHYKKLVVQDLDSV